MRLIFILVGATVFVVIGMGFSVLRPSAHAPVYRTGITLNSNMLRSPGQGDDLSTLREQFSAISRRAGVDVGVAVTHVETGKTVAINGATPYPLYSVFKLPLAITVLQDIEQNRLQLDKKIHITPADLAPGSQYNSELWGKPVERTVAELLELSLGRSDNTSSDKLLQLVGGPAVVTQRMRQLGFQQLDIRSSVREFTSPHGKQNLGSADDLARLLAQLQLGHVLKQPQLNLLLGYMERSTNGIHRLRGDLPSGTPVADKTGTGGGGSATNDVGLITLPGGRGHLAMAVLLTGSKLPVEAQEKVIAELARAAYNANLSTAAPVNR
jgi:beta-lactamase class A